MANGDGQHAVVANNVDKYGPNGEYTSGEKAFEQEESSAERYFSQLDYAFDKNGYTFDENGIVDDEWKLFEEAHLRRMRAENPPAKAFTVKKPSWLQRLLDRLF